MKTTKEFQGNKDFTGVQVKNFVKVSSYQEIPNGFKTLQNEELLKIKGGATMEVLSGEMILINTESKLSLIRNYVCVKRTASISLGQPFVFLQMLFDKY